MTSTSSLRRFKLAMGVWGVLLETETQTVDHVLARRFSSTFRHTC